MKEEVKEKYREKVDLKMMKKELFCGPADDSLGSAGFCKKLLMCPAARYRRREPFGLACGLCVLQIRAHVAQERAVRVEFILLTQYMPRLYG